MAFEMNYTNGKGAHYPSSYWRIGWFNTDRNGKRARVRIDCYFNEAARDANVEGNVLENKFYEIADTDFTAVFETAEDVREAIYDYAKNCADTPGEGDTLVSFFANAVDI